MTLRRPLPVPDSHSAAYWAAAAQDRLVIARCSRCEALSHPPDSVCPHCTSTDPDFVFTDVSGRGTVRSWTTVRQSFLAGFDDLLPFVLVDVELEERAELRMIGRLLDGPTAPLRVGTPVVTAFERLSAALSVPAFRVAS